MFIQILWQHHPESLRRNYPADEVYREKRALASQSVKPANDRAVLKVNPGLTT